MNLKRFCRFHFVFFLFLCYICCNASFAQKQISTLTIKNTGYTTILNKPITIGHVFNPCDVSKGIKIFENNAEIPSQIDVKTRHENGSASHAIISFVLPEIGPKKSTVLTIQSSSVVDSASEITIAQILETDFDAKVVFDKDGKIFEISARELLAQNTTQLMWLKGPVVSEFLLSGIPKTSQGEKDTALNVEFQVRFYDLNKAWVSVVVENDWALQRKNINYNVQVKLGNTSNTTVLNEQNLTHYHYARWRRVFWWGNTPEDLEVHFDLPYFISTGAIPRYDTTVKVTNFITNYGDTSLMGNANINYYFPTTGGREDIGLYPAWSARYMLSFKKMYEKQMYYCGQQSASIPIHVKDQSTGKLWSIEDHPTSSLLNAVLNQQQANDALPPATGFTPWAPDDAHQPSLVYIPYLFTGEYFFLEELQYWANYNFLSQNFFYRGYDNGLLYELQVRGIAWTLRTLADAVFLSPDNTWAKLYFNEKLTNSLEYYIDNFVDSNPLGWLGTNSPSAYPDQCMSDEVALFTAPWESDFLIVSLDHLLDLGFEKARPTRDWLLNFTINRFTNHPQYNKFDGAPYRIAVKDTQGNYYTDWEKIYENTFFKCLPTNSNSLNSLDCVHGYEYIARAALSGASRDDVGKGVEAFNFLDSSLTGECWKDWPTWAFVEGEKRVNQSANFCSETNNSNKLFLEVWPNPFSDKLNIKLNGITCFPKTIDIYDCLGRKMGSIAYSVENSIITWTPFVNSNGLFFIKVSFDGASESKKVVFQKD